MEDVKSLLEEFCKFGNERSYLLLAIPRTKEHQDLKGSKQIVLRRTLESREEIGQTVDRIVGEASNFNEDYRLYVTVNARDTTKAFFELRKEMDEWLEMRLNGNKDVIPKFGRLDKEFLSVLQRDTCRDDTYFLFDLDGITSREKDRFVEEVKSISDSVVLEQKTPNGFHIVSEPFNYNKLDLGTEYDLKTDGLLFLSFIE